MLDALFSTGMVEALLVIIGILLSAFLGTKTGNELSTWWKARKESRYGKALLFLEAGVVEIYHTLYAELKKNPSRKITAEEAKQLRDAAIQAAIKYSIQALGKDIVTTELGPGILDAAVEACIAAMKDSTHTPAQLPEDTPV